MLAAPLALAIVLLLVGNALVYVRISGDSAYQLRQAVRELSAFVESERGLRYDHPVDVTLLDDAAFQAEIAAKSGGGNGGGQTFVALGLADSADQRAKETDDALKGGVTGFYENDTERLVLRSGTLTPYAKTVLVHELTHALQDQTFGLRRTDVEADSDHYLAWLALVEGDAVRIEDAYRARLSRNDRRELARTERALGVSNPTSSTISEAPPVVQLLLFPYAYGKDFVQNVLTMQGQDGLDELFRSPPTSTRQILDPARLSARTRPVNVPRPKLDGVRVDEDVFGVVGLSVVLSSGPGGLDPKQATAALAGWAGDHYLTTTRAGKACTKDDLVLDSTAARDQAAQAMRTWARRQEAAEVAVTGPASLSLLSCRAGQPA